MSSVSRDNEFFPTLGTTVPPSTFNTLSIMFFYLLFAIVLVVAYADIQRRRKYKPPKGLKLPPGPPGKPVVGHFFELLEVFSPKLMYEWREKYGDIVSIDTFGIPIIFVYSDKIARDLLEKSGAAYSDRSPYVMADLLGWNYNVAFFRYGDWWRRHIRAMQQYFNSRAVSTYEPVQLKSRKLLLQSLLETPTEFEDHIKHCIGRIILDVIYAIEVKPKDDTFIEMIHVALEGIAYTVLPGTWLVDIYPILSNISDWIPGIPANRLIKKYRKETVDVVDLPFDVVKKRSTLDYSFVSSSLERLRNNKYPLSDEELVIKNTAGIAYAAGAGTTYSAFMHAFVACLLFPDVQKKMQNELDQVLGDRLPTLEDRAELPYVSAFCHEVLRWRPSLPLGVPHAALEDGIYGDYFIPKGSIIVADSWQILRDKKYGSDPEEFNPERFFQPGVIPPTEQFGFGRRTCPGRFFASNTFFLLIASIFQVFDVIPMKDENGKDIPVSDEITVSSLPFPVPFQCSVVPRSAQAKELILKD